MRNHEIRRLTKDVPNPHHDKRRRYSAESVAVYPAGRLFRYCPAQQVNADQTGMLKARVEPAYIDMFDLNVGYSNTELLYENSEPAIPETAEEELFVADMMHWKTDLLEWIYKSGTAGKALIQMALRDLKEEAERDEKAA